MPLNRIAALGAGLLLGAVPLVTLAQGFEGRWEGSIDIPSGAQALVLDLAPVNGGWQGSVVLPGRGVKGATLGDIHASERGFDASLGAAMPYPVDPPPLLSVQLAGDDELRGDFRLSGLAAPVVLRRTGPAQVDRPPESTPVAAGMTGEWTGRYEFLGYPRDVRLQLDGAHASMRIVGRRTTDIDFALVRQSGGLLSISGNPYDIGFEGLWDEKNGLIEGTFTQGPIELPLRLQRAQQEN